jgi:hypothetical protein
MKNLSELSTRELFFQLYEATEDEDRGYGKALDLVVEIENRFDTIDARLKSLELQVDRMSDVY